MKVATKRHPKETKATFTARRAREIVRGQQIAWERAAENNDAPKSRNAIERFAAVRSVVGLAAAIDPKGEYIDLSTLSDTEGGARALAEQRDRQNAREIKARRALPFLRVARVRIAEVSGPLISVYRYAPEMLAQLRATLAEWEYGNFDRERCGMSSVRALLRQIDEESR